jgi:hypothetical protein
MTDIAERNRAIKRTLEQAFGKGKVKVRGHKGTAYGWVTVKIDHTPSDWDAARILRGKCIDRLREAGCCPGSYDSADYGSGIEMHLEFSRSEMSP